MILEVLKLLGILVVVHYTYFFVWYNIQAKRAGCKLPPTYISFPFGIREVLRTWYWYHHHDALEWVRREVLVGSKRTLRSTLVTVPAVVTSDPENIKSLLATNFEDFSLGRRYQVFYPLLGNGIFTLDNNGWKHSRALLRPQFSRQQVSHLENVKSHVNQLMNIMSRLPSYDAQDLLHRLTMDTATEFLFGESSNTLNELSSGSVTSHQPVAADLFSRAFGDALEMCAYRLFLGPFYWCLDSLKWRKDCRTCKRFVDYYVELALQKPMQEGEEADKYVFIRELTKETRDPLAIRDQALNILLAGRDTTASTLSFTICYLAKNKDVWRKLRNTVLEQFGRDFSSVTFESLKSCKYLQHVISEVLRLHPIVAANFREAVQQTKLPRGGGPNGDGEIYIAKGTFILYLTYILQRDPEYWGEDADEFKPERWETPQKNHNWTYIPFNGGPRICLGQQFALTEIGIVIVRLCQCFTDLDVKLQVPSLYRMKLHERVTISVEGGVPASFTRDPETCI